MDNRNDNPVSHIPRKSDSKNKSYNQEKSQKPYNDLREYLNYKRQTEESKSKGPPSEPKYNFLSDPLRDGNEKQYDNGKFSQRNYVDQRGRGRGLSQRRGYYKGSNNYGSRTKVLNITEENKPYETNKKYGAENEENSQFSGQSHIRPFSHRGNYQSRKHHGRKFESSQDTCTDFERNFQEENTSGRSRKYFPPRNMQQSTRKPVQYGGRQFIRNSKYLDPVNITVEYSVNLGTRKCTLENKETKGDSEGNLNSTDIVPNPDSVCEEKSDELNDKNYIQDESKITTENKNSKTLIRDIKKTDDAEENKEIKNAIDKTIFEDCHQIKEKIVEIEKQNTE